ncbi:MAG: CYTH domain-containing protein [Planctomycetales bacterium]|nr:CYTH domain-containing protein [Planctomycetales bacterium]
MRLVNAEWKARCRHPEAARRAAVAAGARLANAGRQVDTYYDVPRGRLKLREGDLGREIVFYERADGARTRESRVLLVHDPPAELGPLLGAACGVRVVVGKRRELFRAGAVKVHVDEVEGLGSFVEVEVEGPEGADLAPLAAEAERWRGLLGVAEADLVPVSYSDLLLARSATIPG